MWFLILITNSSLVGLNCEIIWQIKLKICRVTISNNKDLIRILSLDGKTVFFEGGEEKAYRASVGIPTFVGGPNPEYAHFKGVLTRVENGYSFVGDEVVDLDTSRELFFDKVITEMSVTWR